MKRYSLLIVFFLVAVCNALADPTFTATLDRNQVAVGERFVVTFTLNGTGRNFQAPAFKEFDVLSGPNQSTSMQIINGAVSQSIALSFILQARTEGTFTIAPASVETNGKRLQSNTLKIQVTKGTPQQQQQQKQNAQSGSGNEEANKIIGKNVYLKAIPSKTTLYQGEQLLVTYKFYVRLQIGGVNVDKMPAFTGFWSQDIENPNQQYQDEVVNGVVFKVVELKKVILFPQQSGNLTIEPMEIGTVVRVPVQRRQRSNDPLQRFFDDPFFGNSYEDYKYTVKSNPLTITVKPLPQENNLSGFNGAVGSFTLNAFLDKPQTRTNEPVTLKVKISGRGNLKLIDSPVITFPPDIEHYDPKITDNISVSATGVSGSRTFEYLLIPRHSGEYKLPAIQFAYFDLDKRAYQHLSSQDILLKVEKGNGPEGTPGAVSGISKEDVQLLGSDIRFIKNTVPEFHKRGRSFFGSAGFYVLSLSPFLFFIGFIFYRRKHEEESGNEALMKNKRATKIAKKRLALAKQFLAEKKKDAFYEETARALWGYVSDRLTIPLAALSKESITQALGQRNVSEETTSQFVDLLNQSEFARFAPASDAGAMEQVYENALGIISTIEQELK